jgi:hypothetical protein
VLNGVLFGISMCFMPSKLPWDRESRYYTATKQKISGVKRLCKGVKCKIKICNLSNPKSWRSHNQCLHYNEFTGARIQMLLAPIIITNSVGGIVYKLSTLHKHYLQYGIKHHRSARFF